MNNVQVAQVIVDVPTNQTNNAYSYLIPANLTKQVSAGMRVKVPFGRRSVTGFVIGISDSTNFKGKLKPISSLVDLYPVINEELLELADWMSRDTFSFKISCLQTMLPGGMRTKVKKVVTALSAQTANSNSDLFGRENSITVDNKKLNSEQLSRLLNLINDKKVKVDYIVDKRVKSVLAEAVRRNIGIPQIESIQKSLPGNAKGQIRLVKELLKQSDKTFFQSDLIKKGIPSSTIKSAEQKGWIKRFKAKKIRDPFLTPIQPSHPLKLNSDQQNAVDQINTSEDKHEDRVYLLEGVTGSGKTEVYLQAIAHTLSLGRNALMLVPEITLTPQIVHRIRSRFGNKVAMLHSALSNGERYDEWQRINNGSASVVVGVRSAVFAPLKNIGLIVIDEEHDSSYKQTDNPRYRTKEIAKWRAKYHHCPVVLGSATPSLESRARASKDVYHLIRLPHRVNQHVLPKVSIIDMKREIESHTSAIMSQELSEAIKEKLSRKEQIILLLNRRGYSAFLMCRNCGYVPKCPNCDISLTVHKDTHSLNCHYCGHREPIPTKCPKCGSHQIRFYGTGSQQLEEQVKNDFPFAKVLRMDVDTTRKKGSHEAIINKFGSHKADILLGTQMIAKGLDFPNVTLVGVLNADSSLQFPDFRSSERTFQLLTQVAGRAGRADKTGEVIIQTFNPDHYSIQLAKQQDYEKFYATEMRIRHLGKYPPYYFLVKLTGSDPNERAVASKMFSVARYLKNNLSNSAILLGPTPKMITRIDNRYYYQVIIKYRKEPNLFNSLNHLLENSQSKNNHGFLLSIDNEPIDLM